MEEECFGRETLKMKRVYILCEGQTEEAFINELLGPYFANLSIYVTGIASESPYRACLASAVG